jgi:sodium/proline symporter
MTEQTGVLITFVFYLLIMIMIGWYFYRRTASLSYYILGGRSLNSWVASLSAQASDMSGWLLLGLPGLAYSTGLGSIWIAIGLGIGAYLNWKVIAKRLRKYTQVAGNALTLPVYLQNRFKAKTSTIRIVSALFILIFFLIYTASGFVAGARLFNTVFDLPYQWALSTGVLVIIVYTFLGGFMAVSWTDFIQGGIMFLALISVPVMAVVGYGGISESVRALAQKELFDVFSAGQGQALTSIGIISLLAWGLGYFGQPHILVRFMAIRHSSQIGKARKIAITWVAISLCCAILIGMGGNIIVERPLIAEETETVFMLMVDILVNPWFTGIVLSAILAAIMSTADSQLLVASSAMTEDLYRAIARRNASQRELVWVSRVAVIFIAAIAFLIAMNPESTVLELVAYAWGGFGAAFGPLMILSLFWARMTLNGAIAGIVVGGLTVLIWKQFGGGIFDLYEIVPGFVFSTISIIIVTLLDKKPNQELIEEFRSVDEMDI